MTLLRAPDRHRVIAGLILLGCLAGCSYIPFSGGALEGTLTAVPEDWSTAAGADVVELETRPDDPYSVKIWVIGLGANLYVHAGANRAAWVEHMEVESNVRMLIEDRLYELRSERVLEAGEFKDFADAYEVKYGRRPRNENVNEAYLFRLSART